MARAPFPEARGRAASWPAPFCVSTCFAEAYLPRGLVLFPADDSPSTREGERTRFLSLSFPLSVPAGRPRLFLSLSSGLQRLRAYARLCSGARVLCEFHSQLHERPPSCPVAPRLHFLRCHGSLFLGAVRAVEKTDAVSRVRRALSLIARVSFLVAAISSSARIFSANFTINAVVCSALSHVDTAQFSHQTNKSESNGDLFAR